MFLAAVHLGLCFSLVAMSLFVKEHLKKFLSRNFLIANERALNDYKSVVRLCMYLTLGLIGVLGIAACIGGVLTWTRGTSGLFFVLSTTAIALKFGIGVGELEKKARALPCATPDLERRYQGISEIWVKKAFPNF